VCTAANPMILCGGAEATAETKQCVVGRHLRCLAQHLSLAEVQDPSLSFFCPDHMPSTGSASSRPASAHARAAAPKPVPMRMPEPQLTPPPGLVSQRPRPSEPHPSARRPLIPEPQLTPPAPRAHRPLPQPQPRHDNGIHSSGIESPSARRSLLQQYGGSPAAS
jgi:hypothetical protein